jgi:hypothetical protein
MPRFRTSLATLLAALLLAACGAAAAGSAPSATQRTSLYGPISLEEIRASSASNGYDLVRALRPNWLHVRGQTRVSAQDRIIVYMNNVRMGPVSTLRDISTADIRVVEFFDPRRAQLRFGSGHEAGAILVSTRS